MPALRVALQDASRRPSIVKIRVSALDFDPLIQFASIRGIILRFLRLLL